MQRFEKRNLLLVTLSLRLSLLQLWFLSTVQFPTAPSINIKFSVIFTGICLDYWTYNSNFICKQSNFQPLTFETCLPIFQPYHKPKLISNSLCFFLHWIAFVSYTYQSYLKFNLIPHLRTALFWVITQRVVTISYRIFEKTYLSNHPIFFHFVSSLPIMSFFLLLSVTSSVQRTRNYRYVSISKSHLNSSR